MTTPTPPQYRYRIDPQWGDDPKQAQWEAVLATLPPLPEALQQELSTPYPQVVVGWVLSLLKDDDVIEQHHYAGTEDDYTSATHAAVAWLKAQEPGHSYIGHVMIQALNRLDWDHAERERVAKMGF